MIVDNAKLAIIVLITVCATVLLALGRIDGTVWTGIVGPIGGYAIGNGVSVSTGSRPTTLLSRRDVRTRASDQPTAIDLEAWSETRPPTRPPTAGPSIDPRPPTTLRPSRRPPGEGS